jgi:hypothetical protein
MPTRAATVVAKSSEDTSEAPRTGVGLADSRLPRVALAGEVSLTDSGTSRVAGAGKVSLADSGVVLADDLAQESV